MAISGIQLLRRYCQSLDNWTLDEVYWSYLVGDEDRQYELRAYHLRTVLVVSEKRIIITGRARNSVNNSRCKILVLVKGVNTSRNKKGA